MKSIVLTGMSGAGKSTSARVLAQNSAMIYFDVDSEIEKKLNLSIPEIFSIKGEDYFRTIEAQIINNPQLFENHIIALGGGAFEDENIRNLLLKNTNVIYLKASVETLLKHLENKNDRPLLNTNDKGKKLKQLLSKRDKNYKLAHYTILTDNRSIEEIVYEIKKCVNFKSN